MTEPFRPFRRRRVEEEIPAPAPEAAHDPVAAHAGSAPAEEITTVVPLASVLVDETVTQVLPPVRSGTAGEPSSRRWLSRARPSAPARSEVVDAEGATPDVTAVAVVARERLFGRTEPAELVADDLTAWFGTHKVLDRVSLTMRRGEVPALIGPSGCGKSTFLRILNRMHEMVPSASLAGQVRIDGVNIYSPDQRITRARRSIGMIFQKPNPFPAMSIYDNVVAGLKLAGVKTTREVRDVLVEDSLRKASLWEEVKDRLDQPGGGLSGGQQQRLCIARSLAVSPQVLLMDEPCSALDPTSTRRVEETIAQLKGSTTIVIVTHNMQQAARVSDTCAFFLAAQNTPGVIVEYGDTEAMFGSPRDQRTSDYVNGRFG